MADINFFAQQYESLQYYTLARKTIGEIDEEWGFRWRYILRRILDRQEPLSLLDVGAGNGYFVFLARKEFQIQASGIEISKEETHFARTTLGVELIHDDITQHQTNYEVVTCFNVIEHVPDPRSFLSALVARIKPGGCLVLTTPNPGCIHAQVHGLRKWNMVDPPHHINLFTKKSMYELLSEASLQILTYETLSTYINLVRKYDTDSLALRRLFFNLLRAVDLGADHFFIARKS